MNNTASFTAIVLLILLCLITPFSSASAEPEGVATVVAIRGTVTALDKTGASRNLSIKSQIFRDDVLKTGKNGQMQIMFTDNSIISLGRGSEMKIAEYRWQPGKKDSALKTQVKEGTFRVMGGALAKDAPQNFKTETPTATIGIRGSMYTFMATQDSLSVLFQGGKGIEVFNEHGKVAITVPGFGTHVVLNAPPARPSRFTQQDLNNLNRQLNGNNGDSNKGGSDNGTPPPLADNNLTPPQPPVPPVLPPANELPSAPDFTLPPPPPADGIFAYEGTLGGVSTGVGTYAGFTDTFINNLILGVNWHNHRIFGAAYDTTTTQNESHVFFFGSVNGSTVSDLTIIGADKFYPNNEFGSINGNGVGVFAGTAYDFFAFGATGNTSLITDSSIHDTWTVAGGGQQVPVAMTPVAPMGTENWQGFVTGLSVNMTNPYGNTIATYQSGTPNQWNNFNMTVNKDAGTISGIMNPGNELHDSSFNSISDLQVGGNTTNSVYLRDDLMAALINTGANSPTLKPQGNFMVVADPPSQVSSYVTWGYWQVAYTDTGYGGTDRLMAAPYSYWIAGNPTPASVISNLQTSNFTGVYNGKAFGTEISTNGLMPIIGTCALTANFGASTVSGNIDFPGIINLPIPTVSPNISGNQFSAGISGQNISGMAKGAFFGPAANAVGGNFSAVNSGTSKQYLGIFGGNR